MIKYRNFLNKTDIVFLCIFLFAPLGFWSLFSLLYYGFLFPNTAYAKLNAAIPRHDLVFQGIKYIWELFRYDSITFIMIFLAICFLFFCRDVQLSFLKIFCISIFMDLIYVIYIGGDFMLGRFFACSYMLSVLIFCCFLDKNGNIYFILTVIVFLLLYGIFYYHTPLNSPVNYKNKRIELGVADERGFYFPFTSIFSYLREKNHVNFPRHPWIIQGLKFKNSSEKVIVVENIGMFGYASGINKIIIDSLALSDPLLARLPVCGHWRIGHFRREIPEGYVESIKQNKNLIKDPDIHKYYDLLKNVTSTGISLFSWERIKTIVLFNFGYYDSLSKKIRENFCIKKLED